MALSTDGSIDDDAAEDAAADELRYDADLRYDTVSFLSDYGHADEFVGLVHSVIRQLEPRAAVIDITHEIAPYDVRAAGLTLARSIQYLAPGVIMAVVDPGVGSSRRSIAVEVADGAAVLLGPDNGVLAPAVGMVGGAARAVWLNNPDYQLPAHGPLFDGRDVFAPAAAHLCQGVPLEELGEEIDPAGLLPGILPLTRDEEGALVAEVLWVDRYGNAQLNVDPEELDALGEHFEVLVDAGRRSARRARAFADITPGGVGLVTDSYGLIALAAHQASAAEDLGLSAADPVTLRPVAGPEPQEMPVQLGRRSPGGGA